MSAALGSDFSFAVLKGRSNYLCRQRVSEIGADGQLTLATHTATDTGDPPDADDTLTADAGAPGQPGGPGEAGRIGQQLRRLVRWAGETGSGDRAELDFEPSGRAWAMVSTTARECPGAHHCPSGHDCFAERARERAAEVDVVVVNSHLYGAHLASGGSVLPPHEVVVFDEAHDVEDVMSDSLGVEVGPGRFRALAGAARPLLDAGTPGAVDAADAVAEVGDSFERALRPWVGRRLPPDATGAARTGITTGTSSPNRRWRGPNRSPRPRRTG